MLMCESCNAAIEEDNCVTYWDMHGFEYGPGEPYRQCPYCESLDVCNAILCSGCDEYFCGEYVQVASGEIYCEKCFIIKDTEEI